MRGVAFEHGKKRGESARCILTRLCLAGSKTRWRFVTGGARGLGRGIATVLAREGADITVADLAVAEAQGTLTAVEGEGRHALVVETDVTDAHSAARCVQETITRLGGVDILVNNAGVVGGHLGEQVTAEDWDACFAGEREGAVDHGQSAAAALQAARRRKGRQYLLDRGTRGRADVPPTTVLRRRR